MSIDATNDPQKGFESTGTRRDFLRKGLTIGLGTGAVVVTSQLITQTPAQAGIQSGWRYCRRCKGLVRTGGSCPHPSYSSHDTTNSFNYYIPYVPHPDQSVGQRQWYRCSNCQTMFFGGYTGAPIAGVCNNPSTAGGDHIGSGSLEYIMRTSSASDRQSNWRHCLNCDGMFWGGDSNSWCPIGGLDTHDGTGSWNYRLQFDV